MEGIPSCAAHVPIFQVLPAEELGDLGSAMRHRHFVRGERVAATGDTVTDMIVVARGRLNVVHANASGREQLVRSLGPGQFLGEMALFIPAVHEGDLVVAEEADCCFVPREAVQAILHRHPAVALRLVSELARRVAEAEQQIADLGLKDVGQRLAAELLRAAGGEDRVQMPVPWAELAVKLGTTPESLSRKLRALTEQGLISQEGVRTVVIHDREGLHRMAEG